MMNYFDQEDGGQVTVPQEYSKKIISNITKKREGKTRTVVVKRANSCDSGEIEETKTSAVSFFKLFSFILFCRKEKKW